MEMGQMGCMDRVSTTSEMRGHVMIECTGGRMWEFTMEISTIMKEMK
jgi:hypothetical protein